ncbi:MAG: HD-like signal output (HDOD) protein [Myxococcota bacterium]|jgi:HD-like signal output (HDOD) protein
MKRLFRRRKKSHAKALRALLGDHALPSFPAATMRTLALLRHDDATTEQIGQSVMINPGVAVRIMTLVNSAAFGLRTPVSNVVHAVGVLGRDRIEQLIVATAVHGQLPQPKTPGFCVDRFWRTAARRAAVSRALAERITPKDQSRAFLAGLLQDMAIPLLASANPDGYSDVLLEHHGGTDQDLDKLEAERFGWTHAAVGSWLATHWELPEELIIDVGGHHVGAEDSPEANLAVRLVGCLQESYEPPALDALVDACEQHTDLAPDVVIDCVERGLSAASEIAALMR